VLALIVSLWGFVAPGAARQTFDLGVLDAVVRIEARIPADARTARGLGTEREGNGVVIDDNGLVLTIGYIILEAASVTVYDGAGSPVAAQVLAYDTDTGLGLVRAARGLGVPAMPLGSAAALAPDMPVLVTAFGGRASTIGAVVVARREFAGFWEYLLEDAIFTSPPHPNWAGAALVGPGGRLLGIGSLFVRDALAGPEPIPGNMFVPIDLLAPIFADLLTEGRSPGPQRPWLGMFTMERRGHVMVTRVSPDGPADRAGFEPGDVVLAVGDQAVSSLPEFYRAVWSRGQAGDTIPLRRLRGRTIELVPLVSGDRYHYLRLDKTY